MSTAKLEELRKDVEELTKLSCLASRKKVKDILLIEIRKAETEIIRLSELEKPSKEDANKEDSSKISSNTSAQQNKCYEVKLSNYAWDQSDKFVKIFIDLNGVGELPNEKVACEFCANEMTLKVKELNNRNYTLSIKNLLHPIQPTTSKWKVKKDMVVVFLNKAKENKQWSSLTITEKPNKKFVEPDANTDPTKGIMDFMKQMYMDGDDEMKRAIAKAWTEGNKPGV